MMNLRHFLLGVAAAVLYGATRAWRWTQQAHKPRIMSTSTIGPAGDYATLELWEAEYVDNQGDLVAANVVARAEIVQTLEATCSQLH